MKTCRHMITDGLCRSQEEGLERNASTCDQGAIKDAIAPHSTSGEHHFIAANEQPNTMPDDGGLPIKEACHYKYLLPHLVKLSVNFMIWQEGVDI